MTSFEWKSMNIDIHQQKLISNPLRMKIIFLLSERALTAKQVADELGKSAGSIHYHIQQLYKGNILEIESTKEYKGIIEKYYRAKANQFHLNQTGANVEDKGKSTRGTTLSLTKEELQLFRDEVDELFLKYFKKTVKPDEQTKNRDTYEVNCSFKKLPKEGES
ncbi:winged helix-turn-helix domain-containing protein [Cytobacillus sp. FSL K6-0129]|uniref:ArsR/SmtB family transcription factor n=1 Tax=Cytobacillus sp. FSL K6-0129 TaxID=2921421 RepID=UPI0030FC602F